MRSSTILLAFPLLVGCYDPSYPAEHRCSNATAETRRCPEGMECNGQRCVPTGSVLDGGPADGKADGGADQGVELAVTTFAGSGVKGSDNGPALLAKLNAPRAVLVHSGKVYIVDSGNNCIRVVTGGQVSTFAGVCTALAGFKNGPAATARFSNPSDVAVDSSGKVYVSDTENHCIRVVESGQVSTFAGICDTGLTKGGFVDGPAASARFNTQAGIDLDGQGAVYVADLGNHCIRKVQGGQVSTVAGLCKTFSGAYQDGPANIARFNVPGDVAVGAGVLFVADTFNHRVRKIVQGQVSTVAGSGQAGFADGKASLAAFKYPAGLDVDGQGGVVLADKDNHRVRRIDIAAGTVSTVAGSGAQGFLDGPALSAIFNGPSSVALDAAGKIYVAGPANHRIRLIAP
jgi:hypothetical protein